MVYKVSITPDLITLAQGAHSSYELFLEKQRAVEKEKIAKKVRKQKMKKEEKKKLKISKRKNRLLKI